MTSEADTPSEDEVRAQDCLAKANYCKWAASREPDKDLQDFYTKLSVAWEKEANELKRAAAK